MRKKLVLALALLASPLYAQTNPMAVPRIANIPAPADPDAIPLYRGVAPGSEGAAPTEVWTMMMGERVARNVTRPTLTPVLPDPKKATGAAVIVVPGGGFVEISMDNEGWPIARYLADHGIAAFVLKYRLEATPDDTKAFLQAMGARMAQATQRDQTKGLDLKEPQATADALQALRMVRQRAGDWGVDPKRVGMLGFSAGAMTTMQVVLTDAADAHPDFIGYIYGPMNPVTLPASAPPMFAALAADDPLFGKGGLGVIESWRSAGKPVELHYFEHGGHGFGSHHRGSTSDLWVDEFYAWLKDRGELVPAK